MIGMVFSFLRRCGMIIGVIGAGRKTLVTSWQTGDENTCPTVNLVLYLQEFSSMLTIIGLYAGFENVLHATESCGE